MVYGRNRKEEGGKVGREAEEYQETEGRSMDDKQMDEKTIGERKRMERLAERQRNIRKLKEDLWMTNRWMKRL